MHVTSKILCGGKTFVTFWTRMCTYSVMDHRFMNSQGLYTSESSIALVAIKGPFTCKSNNRKRQMIPMLALCGTPKQTRTCMYVHVTSETLNGAEMFIAFRTSVCTDLFVNSLLMSPQVSYIFKRFRAPITHIWSLRRMRNLMYFQFIRCRKRFVTLTTSVRPFTCRMSNKGVISSI